VDSPTPDADLRTLLAGDVAAGWRAFIDRHTSTILGLIERASIRDRDEAMDLYTLVCERLAADDCARLRQWNPARGQLAAWLAVVVRRTVVDWVRSRAGRRRLFGSIKALDALDRRIFELHFWHERPPHEIAEVLSAERREPVGLARVLSGLDAVHAALSDRQRGELLSAAIRSRQAASLEVELERGGWDPVDQGADVEQMMDAQATADRLERVLASLDPEDAAIVRLRYVEGLSLADVGRALHLPGLGEKRLRDLIARIQRLAVEGGPT
jgi:DNA-directed RNA polymerase specialized sigma24 family protein